MDCPRRYEESPGDRRLARATPVVFGHVGGNVVADIALASGRDIFNLASDPENVGGDDQHLLLEYHREQPDRLRFGDGLQVDH